MKALLTFLAQILMIAGLVVAAIYWLELEPELIKVVVLGTAGLMALVIFLAFFPKLFSGLRRLRQNASTSSQSSEKKARKLRAKGYRSRLREVFKVVKSGEAQRFFYREKHSRPWWLVVGASGAGKSAWLENNLGGTEIVEPLDGQVIRFYVTERVVCVEVTVGETTPSHFEEELAILVRTLERCRPTAPIAGVVCISRWNRSNCEASEIQQLCQHLRVDVPVLLVVSHMDEVEGFTTVLRDTPAEALVEWCNPEGRRSSDRNLLQVVKQRVLSSLAHLGLRGVAPQGFRFLHAFEQCQKSAWSLVGELQPLTVQAVIYSAAREVLGVNPSALQLHLVRDGSQSRRSKEYFRAKRTRLRFGALVAVITSGFLAWGAVRASREYTELLSQTGDRLQRLSDDSEALADYEHFLEFLPNMRKWRTGGPQRSLGLFNTETVEPIVSRHYVQAMCQEVFQHLVADAESELYRFIEGRGSAHEAQELLRFYLLFTRSTKDTPSPWEVGEAEWVEAFITQRWFEAFRQGRTGVPENLRKAVRLYGEILREWGELDPSSSVCRGRRLVQVVDRNDEIVRDVRLKISKLQRTNYNLKEMIKAINESDARPVEVVVGFKNIHGTKQVAAAFTRSGWDQMKSLLSESGTYGDTPQWLLDQSKDAHERRADCEYIRDRYMKTYIETWRDVISSIRIDSSTAKLEDIRSIYDEVVNEEPLKKIFSKVYVHTNDLGRLTCSEAVGGVVVQFFGMFFGHSVEAAEEDNRVAAAFRGLNSFAHINADGESRLLDYHTWIRSLRDGVADAVSNERGEYSQLDVELAKTEAELDRILGEQEWREWKTELRAVLFPPLDALRGIVDKNPFDLRTKLWCTRVILPARQLVKYYPFQEKSRRQTSLKEIRKVFHPVDGEIAQFRREFLLGETSASGRLSVGAEEFMARAHELGVLLFPGADDTNSFEVTFRCSPSISPVDLTVGEQSFSYSCDSVDRFSGLWPDGSSAVLSYGFRQEGQRRRGNFKGHSEFAIFKLFEQATIAREGFSAKATFDLENLGKLPVRLEFETVDDRGRRGALLFGFDAAEQRFLAPFRREILQGPPTQLYKGKGFEPTRRCE